MNDLSWAWLFFLMITHAVSYYLGREDGRTESAGAPASPALQKPLTLRELHALVDSEEEHVIYFEAADDDRAYAHILSARTLYTVDEVVPAANLIYKTYGITWRAWASGPTDEERAAAPWEDDHENA